MLIRFVPTNFLSFNKEKEFNMLASSFRTHKHHIYKAGKVNVLKGTAIYGPNGAGKSNLVKAIEYFKRLVENGKLEKNVNYKKFKLKKENAKKPVELELEFFFNGKIYAYGVTLEGYTIEKEWLYLSGIDKEDKMVFERKKGENNQPQITLASRYLKTQKTRLLVELMEENLLKNNELLLGKFESLKIEEITDARKWICSQLLVIYPHSKIGRLIHGVAGSEKFTNFTNELLRTFDTGVKELAIEDIDLDVFFGKDDLELKEEILKQLDEKPYTLFEAGEEMMLVMREEGGDKVKKVVALHDGVDCKAVKFELGEESDGTRRLLDFIPAFFGMLNTRKTFIIDEIDQSLHPTLLHLILKKIMDEKKTSGQLIFTTHESNLLDQNIFRQDEIWFAEKDKTGATQLYSLNEFKPRYDLDLRKGYLKGRFGAIPFTADLKQLNWKKDAEEERI